MSRAQCIVHRKNRILMVKQKYSKDDHEFWCLPGGAIEEGETPEEAAIRELKEECCVNGTIVRETGVYVNVPDSKHLRIHTFLVEIGSQEPRLGTDPEKPLPKQGLIDIQWLRLSEIPERDRAYLWAAGLLGIEEFKTEANIWGDSISYPQP